MARGGLLAGLLLLTLTAQAGPVERKAPMAIPDPRVSAAQQNMQAMAQQEEACAIETGYFVALESLNDGSVTNTLRPWEYINDNGGSYAIRPEEGRFRPNRITFRFDIFSYPHWGGPYLTYQSGTTQTENTPYDKGSPLDPWWNPYYFFSPLGLLRGDTGDVSSVELYGDHFGTYTIVSLGPDGVMSNDDIAYSLGVGVNVVALTSLRGADVTTETGSAKPSGKTAPSYATSISNPTFKVMADSPVILRGCNLGTPAADARLIFNGEALDTVTTWTTRAIHFKFPPSQGGKSGPLAIQRGAATTNALSVKVVAPPNAITRWPLFE